METFVFEHDNSSLDFCKRRKYSV